MFETAGPARVEGASKEVGCEEVELARGRAEEEGQGREGEVREDREEEVVWEGQEGRRERWLRGGGTIWWWCDIHRRR